MRKIIITFGTRPEAIKMAPVYFALKKEKSFSVKLVLTGQHTEMLDEALDVFGIKPEYNLGIMLEGQTLSDITSSAIARLDKIYKEEKPDIVLVHGDTATTLSAAIVSFYNGIPSAHVEAGLRTGHSSEPFPEEMVRILTDRVCTILFPPTKIAFENLVREGLSDKKILVTGNTVIDAIELILKKPLRPPKNVEGKKFVFFTMHRRESWGRPMEEVVEAIKKIFSKNKDIFLIWPVHPNPVVKKAAQPLQKLKNVFLLQPINYLETLWFLKNCLFLITDSGGIQEEATYFGKKVLLLRRFTERPEGVESGFIDVVGLSPQKLAQKVSALLSDRENLIIKKKCPYGDGKASERILQFLKNSNRSNFI